MFVLPKISKRTVSLLLVSNILLVSAFGTTTTAADPATCDNRSSIAHGTVEHLHLSCKCRPCPEAEHSNYNDANDRTKRNSRSFCRFSSCRFTRNRDTELSRAVGEIIVACIDKIVRPRGLIYLHGGRIKVRARKVKLGAIGWTIVLIGLSRRELFALRPSCNKICFRILKGKCFCFIFCEESHPVRYYGKLLVQVIHFHDIVPVRVLPPLCIVRITLCVEIRSGPLKMHVVTLIYVQILRHEVVLHSWIRLDNIPTAAARVKIPDGPRDAFRALGDLEDV